MIVHVFTAERYHLVPTMVKGYATLYKNDAQHRFLLIGGIHMDRQLYNSLFQEIGFTDYYFITSKWQLFRKLRTNRNHSILFHGENYSHFLIAFIVGCNHVNWICWGSGASVKNNWESKLSAFPKAWIYQRFKSIVTLVDDDKRSIIRDFKVNSEKIKTIAYASAGEIGPLDTICLKLLKESKVVKNEKPIVLLGNNPSNIGYYINLMDLLKPFKGKIRVHCMMNYSVNRNSQYEDFIRHGNDLFDEDFLSNEEFYQDTECYVNYMNTCDIYMCGSPHQTGLGALTTVLQLGKKVYVTGKNYNWATEECGAIVFNINDSFTYDDFVKPLNKEEIMHNYQAVLNYKSLSPKLCREYLHQLNLVE